MEREPLQQGEIDRVAYGGMGVTRLEGCVVFVPGVLPGERVRYRVTARHRTYRQAELLEVLEASPDRRPTECPLMIQPRGVGPQPRPFCPGCAYGHAEYTTELAIKQGQLEEVMARIGGLKEIVCATPLAAPRPLHYRNKITLHTQKDGRETRFGYMGFDNRTVLDIPLCPLAAPPAEDLLKSLRAKPGFFETLRHGMDVTIRWTEQDGALFWRGNPDPRAPWLQESTPAGAVRVPREGFFQVNPWAAGELFKVVRGLILQIKPARFVDLYCGVGFFSLAAFSAGVPEGVGVDSDSGLIMAATENARRHGMDGYSFQAALAEHGLRPLLKEHEPLLLVDPPRTGLDPGVIAIMTDSRPRNILYVSCAADTLARDLSRLTSEGYRVTHLQLVDMFPRTAHFETVAWLQAGEA